MKNINEYLKQQALLEQKYHNAGYLEINNSINNVIGNIDEVIKEYNITYELIDNYITESLCVSLDSDSPIEYWNNIFETLISSHDYNKLINKLKDYFGSNWLANYDINFLNKSKTKSFEFYIENCKEGQEIEKYVKNKHYTNPDSIELPNELNQIMNFYNYYFSKVSKSYGPEGLDGDFSYKILCEPKYSDKVTDIIYNKYNGILYHITPNENVDRILKRGLQLKGKSNIYRYIEPRINLYVANQNNIIKRAEQIANQKGYKKDAYTILKIDLNYGNKNKFNNSSYSIDFYHDNMYNEEYFVYTYGLIHPRFISIVSNMNEGRDDLDEKWLNNEGPVKTQDGRPAIIVSIDMSEVPNIIKGQVKMKDKLYDYEWYDDGICLKAVDQFGNPKKPDEADKLIKAL